jgi:hypothetical protein
VTRRLACCVPFCRRSTGRTEFSEWLCGDHWRLIDKSKRRVYGRYMRQWRRYGPTERVHVAAGRIWNRLKREAIERAVGIA